MRYFKLFDFLSPEGDLYRLNGDKLEFKDDLDGEWYEQYSYSAGGYVSPEDWFVQLLAKEALFGVGLGSFEEVPAP